MPRTEPPSASAPENTLNSVFRSAPLTSTSSRPKRMSGLSLPKRRIASSHVRRGSGSGTSTPSSLPYASRMNPSPIAITSS